GTPAARIPNQVPKAMAKARAAQLREAGDRQFAKLCASRVGMTERVLVERDGLGRTEQFVPVRVDHGEPGDILTLKVAGADAAGLIGQPAGERHEQQYFSADRPLVSAIDAAAE
ncbi:MAG: hypothetical protein KDJ19_12185, partial [Hyphomicrobiaceae bacterium]|nr:hypothetical protein [Hyphomicrobiaceae bacterium]